MKNHETQNTGDTHSTQNEAESALEKALNTFVEHANRRKGHPSAEYELGYKKPENVLSIAAVFLTAIAVVASIVAAIFAGRAYETARGQQNIMQGQLTEMQSEDRPWISIEMKPSGDLRHDASGWHFIIKYVLNNVGKSPAVDADFMAIMIPWQNPQPILPPSFGFSAGFPTTSVENATSSVCGDQAELHEGRIIFPENSQTGQWQVDSSPGQAGFIPGFIIIGCATYKISGDPNIHETVETFELSESAYGKMVDISRNKIPFSELAFFPYSERGNWAN
jgi:hypothetical protein